MLRKITVVMLVAAAAILAAAAPASAHALVRTSEPASGAQLPAAPDSVTIVFTEDPEPSFGSIRVLDAMGAPHERGTAAPVPGKSSALRVAVGDLEGGRVYTVIWRVVSRVDGHATAGAFAFGIGVSPAGAPVPPAAALASTPRPSTLEVGARFLLLAGLILLVGAGATGLEVFRDVPANVRRLAVAAVGLCLAGTAGLAESQRRAAETSFDELLNTALGRALVWRTAAVAVAAVAIACIRGSVRLRRIAITVAAAAGLAAIVAHVGAGHAAAVASRKIGAVAGQSVHIAAAGIWIGGLAALLAGLRGHPDPGTAVRRFSRLAGGALVIVAGTGALRAALELGSPGLLFSSAYGRLVVVKVVLIGALGILGAVNRYVNVPRAAVSTAGLRSVSRVELAVAALAVAAAALLANLAPPRPGAASPRTGTGIVASATDFARTLHVSLRVDPGDAGPSRFVVRLTDPAGGGRIDAARVVLRFTFLDEPSGETELALRRTAAGRYEASGADLSLSGRWRVVAFIDRGVDSKEITLEIATRCRASVSSSPGLPTLYTVTLPSGSMQGYVDPGRPGRNEVHATFFTKDGGEASLAELPSITAGRSGLRLDLQPRKLGPGHVVAKADLDRGTWRFDVRNGETRVCFEHQVGR